MVDFPAIKDEKGFRLERKDIFVVYTEGLKKGKYIVGVKQQRGPGKTMAQLAYYYAVILPTAYRQMVEDGNDTLKITIDGRITEFDLTEDLVDTMFKKKWAKKTGQKKAFKRDMSKQECSEFMDYIIKWCALYLHAVIPPPTTEECNG